MCGEVHSCNGAGKVKCWTGFIKHFCSGKQLLFPELGRLALSQLWFRILGMNVCNFFGNGLACLSVILSARGAHMNNLKPLILLRWVCGTSPVLCALTDPVVSGCVSFSRKWRRRSACKEDGWGASRLRISMAVTWTKHPSEPLSWTLKWLWQCQVLCGWNGWRLSGAAGTLPYIFAVPFSHCFSRSSVYRCKGTISSKPPKNWCCEYKLLKPLLWVGIMLVHSVPLFSSCSHCWNCVQKVCSAFFLTWSYNCLFVLLCAGYVVGFVLLEILLSGSTLLLSLAGILWTRPLKNAGG